MTESASNEPGNELFTHIDRWIQTRGVDIRSARNGSTLQLTFVDGQRLLINQNMQTGHLWLASNQGGQEFFPHNGRWYAHDQSEFFGRLTALIEHTIASNPLNARAPLPPAVEPAEQPTAQPKPLRLSSLHYAVLAAVTLLVGIWAILHISVPPASKEAAPKPTPTLSLNKLHYACEDRLPANGKVTRLSDTTPPAPAASTPVLTLKNGHSHPVLLILIAPQQATPLLSVLALAGQSAQLQLPEGSYDMLFSTGKTWCNPRSGFSEGHLLKFGKALEISADKPQQLDIQTVGSGMEDFQPFLHTNTEEDIAAPLLTAEGNIELQRHPNGHFYLPGSLETTQATFMIDTEAASTSIPDALAKQAGIRKCRDIQTGSEGGCIALIPHLTLGNVTLKNITATVVPELETGRLGANVLRHFRLTRTDATLTLEQKQGKP